ncbi:MAG TPA: MFS transporter [Actinomycetota bacterium]|nr:MFS transporter [Actinomycetota bacterium]
MRIPFIRALTQRDFALWWAGQTISLVGDGIFSVALAWQSLQLPNGARTLGLVFLVRSGARVAWLLVAGTLADRYEKRLLMLVGDTVQMVAVGALAYAASTGDLQAWQLVTVAGVSGAGSAVFLASSSAIVPELVDEEHFQSANSLRSTSIVLSDLAGSATGGVVVAAAGTAAAFTVDAATFLASIVALTLIRPKPRGERATETNVFRQVKEGLGYVVRTPWIWVTLVTVGTLGNCLSWGPLPVLIPLFVERQLDGGPEVLGFVFAGYGVGGLAGTVFAGSKRMAFASVVPAYLGWGIGTVAIGLLAVAPAALVAAALLALVGFAGQIAEVTWATLLQKFVPPNLLGRVTSTDWLVSLSLQPLGVALAVPVATWIGVPGAFAAGAAITIAVMTAGLSWRPVRRILPTAETEAAT